MPGITVEEKWNGRHQTIGENPQQQNDYLIFGTNDDTEAQAAMLAYVPMIWQIGNYPLPIQSSEISERLAEYIYAGSVTWAWGQPLEEGDELISFDTGGGTHKLTQSYGTRRYGAPQSGTSNWTATATGPNGALEWSLTSGAPGEGMIAVPPQIVPSSAGQEGLGKITSVVPDFQGTIGVTDSGIEGVEVPLPALQFSVQRRFDEEFVTPAYLNILSNLTGTVNNAPFWGFEAGEVRFDGATGQQKLGKPWDITFKFTRSQNAANLTIGPITGVAKLGWEYLWVRYKTTSDTAAKRIVQVPMGVYVETVANYVDFTALGINQT
jgi:hypothetical protein